MINDVVVVFTSNNARVFHDPQNMEDLLKLPNAVLNPDLMKVKAIAPHFWKLVDGEVLPMNTVEQHARIHSISMTGVDNEIRAIAKIKPGKFFMQDYVWHMFAAYQGALAIMGLYILHLFHKV